MMVKLKHSRHSICDKTECLELRKSVDFGQPEGCSLMRPQELESTTNGAQRGMTI